VHPKRLAGETDRSPTRPSYKSHRRVAAAAAQTIDFPSIADLAPGAAPQPLRAAASSGLPVYYEVDYGPVRIARGRVVVDQLPAGAPFPPECWITAYQIGRRVGNTIAPAVPVSRVFSVRVAHRVATGADRAVRLRA